MTRWGKLEDDAYKDIIAGLNEQQNKFRYHFLHNLKTNTERLFIFLSGGAGVEKSVVTETLFRALLKHYSQQLHNFPDNFISFNVVQQVKQLII